jgi:exodeoxyribonuclease VII large subunit
MVTKPTTLPPQTLTVSELTAQIKDLVEGGFPSVWVAGEISNYSRPQSGHSYFTLKDDQAQIRAVVWRGTAVKLKFELADGLDVICHGHVDVYAPRGSYQLVVDQVQPKGVGALELALRKLREKLAAEGLFDPARKRKLPAFPRRVAFVTSPTGAAVRDFLEVLRRRWRGVDVLIIPARVQGEGAAKEIVAGIRLAHRLSPPPDVLVVGRGGGNLEDLWAFNEEPVVRAIAASRIPTVSAVGHEIDVTLSDLAADVRALTPSEAAERVVPSVDELTVRLRGLGDRLRMSVARRLAIWRARLEALAGQRIFRRPFELVHDRSRCADELALRANSLMWRTFADRESSVATLAGKLQSLSPLAVLGRGYNITQDAASGAVIRSVRELRVGQAIVTRFADGAATSEVQSIDNGTDKTARPTPNT